MILAIDLSRCYVIYKLPTTFPLAIYPIENNYIFDFPCAGFGVWSRYLPLSSVIQIGEIGILDSSCFHLFRIEDRMTKDLYFVFYECINLETKIIQKYFQFLGFDGIILTEYIPINHSSYEYVWYFQGFFTAPSETLVSMYIYREMNQIFNKEIQLKFQFKEKNKNLIIGGDLKVSQNFPIHQFSYFPGQIKFIESGFFTELDSFQEIIESNKNEKCFCQNSAIIKIPDVKIENQDQYEFISQNTNCQQFLFSGWVKIKGINQIRDEVYFQLFKLSSNYQNPKLVQANLCPFQLFYKISSNNNQIIITTYSYTFPSLNIDFQNNPFLKTETFNINWDIQLWHYILVQKLDTQIQISITFYIGFNQEKLSMNLEVIQFNMVQFKLLYGNILQSINFLTIQIIGLKLINCPNINEVQISCHPTCKQCDGPTKDDCLSCFEQSNRRLISEHKVCICEYGNFDQNDECVNYKTKGINLIHEHPQKQSCKYGFFEYDGECYQCPSIVNINVISCLECVQNPKNWSQTLYCETTLISDKNGNTSKYIKESKLYYIILGDDLEYCPDCQLINPSYNQIESIFQFKNFCSQNKSIQNQCYQCGFRCLKCEILSTNLHCIKQDISNNFPNRSLIQICDTPNFINFYNQCVNCEIKYCQYCFNYLASDPTKTTFGFDTYSLIDEEIKIGCAQCNEGYIFEFKTGTCIEKKPIQENCLRSYINFQNEEICTLSAIDDFSIAFEIINCHNHILKCKQCIKTFQSNIKCLICEDGYQSSSKTGICSLCIIQDSKQCFEDNNQETWKWLVQGFITKFLPNQPLVYPSLQNPRTIVTQCIEGYKKIMNMCKPYCDEVCSVCQGVNNQYFTCSRCKLNYYKDPIRSQVDGKCIQCPSLCQLCENRPLNEINEINPYFQITTENLIYTNRCIQKIPQSQVELDAELKIAKYCYQNDCSYNFEQIYEKLSCNDLNYINIFIEKQYNYQYFNEIGLQQFTEILQLQENCVILNPDYTIQNNFKQKIFSMQLTRLKIQGTPNPILLYKEYRLQILQFDQIILSQLIFQIKEQLALTFTNRDQSIDLKILDTKFYSILDSPSSISIQAEKYLNFYIQNLEIFDLSISNSVFFNITCTDQGDDIIITNFQLQNCILTNSTLFQFQSTRRKIIIKNFAINSCQFYNSSITNLINQNVNSKLIFNEVLITNSIFHNSILINSIDKTTISINFVQMIQNMMINSKLIILNYNLYCNEIYMEKNEFISFQFISQISSIFFNQEIEINYLEIYENTIKNFSIFITEQKQSSSKVNFLLQNFYFDENSISCSQEQYLIEVNCFNLTMQNIFITSTTNYRFISLLAIPYIRIENVIYENLFQEYKVGISSDCFKNCISHSQLLQVSGFKNITLFQIQILNSFSIDQSIISIQSNPLFLMTKNEYIIIKDMIVKGNILIKQHKGIIFSLLEFYSEKPQTIEIENLNFQENIFHQYEKDPSESFASLLYADSGLSLIKLKNIICTSNSLTNSSSSYIYLISNEIFVQNFKVENHNYIGKEFWIKYYEIELEGDYNQNEISYIISKTFNFENVGGVLSSAVTKFTFHNGVFSFLQTQSSQVFKINLQGDGIVIISNCNITHAYNSLISKSQNDGAITINAKKSLLSLYVKNITLTDVLNKLSSSIFTIYSSSNYNYVQLNDIFALNCFSLINQIINFESDFQNVQLNIVKIENFRIIQTEQALISFLQTLGKLSLIEMQRMITNNAIMNFQGCQLTLIKIQIEGIVLSTIIKITDSKQILLKDSQFINILSFYPLNLIDIQQSNILQSKVCLQKNMIKNFNDFKLIYSTLTYFNYNHINLNLTQCKLQSIFVQQIPEAEFLQSFFDALLQNSNKNGSLIKINCATNEITIYFTQNSILNNNCSYCQNGLLYLEISDFKRALISELYCMNNYIQNYGCIFAKSDQIINNKLLIDYSNFIANNGRQGVGISVQNLKVNFSNSKVLNNNAFYKGGGFYFEEGSQRFTIQSTIICYNSAKEAGGIYLSGNSKLNQNNFIQSILLFNTAKLSTNNINELPMRLSLQINGKEMYSQEQIIENRTYQILKLRPFKIISQDSIISTSVLLIPSGQQIYNYQLYNSKIQQYQSYISQLSILFKNSRDEQQINFLNSSCNVNQQIYDIQLQQVIESNNISTIGFNQEQKNFNLSFIEFNFDPYKQDNKIQEIIIYCSTQNEEVNLAYRMRINSFLCQLGEFYIFSGCQKCQSEQGFYSVTYNTTKCSIFDKNKFDSITSNKIQLKPGFWRPNQISDFVESCYKNPIHCLGGWNIGNDLCFKGHIGGLCEECDRYNIRGDGQFFKNQQYMDCQKCQQFSQRIIAFFIISIWAIISTLMTINSIEKSNKLFAQLKLRQKHTEILFKLNQDHQSILLKLYLNYLWVFSLIFTFNIQFTFSLNFVKQSNDTSYFMANYFECFLFEIQEIELIYSRILVMLGLMVAQIFIIFFGYFLFFKFIKSKFQSRVISITILYLYIQNYASLINQFFSILAIRKISNLNYIQGDVSLIYGSQNHIQWIQVFVIPGSSLIGLILPLSLFFILYINREQHNKIQFRRHIGYLFNEYTRKNYFWEIIKLWKKTIIIIILIYYETDIFFKATLLGLCLLIYQLLAHNYSPYILKKFNNLDIQSGQLCQIAIFLGAINYISEQQDQNNIQIIIQIFIILDSIALSYPFIFNILRVYYQKYRLSILSFLLLIFKTLKHSSKITKFLNQKLFCQRQKEEKAKKNIEKLQQLLHSNDFGRQFSKSHTISSPTSKIKQISINLGSTFTKGI
ncbi:unnamed protein product [Paramecium sonneborni]|uniref:Transmembrane protein n=1 Tax=Paramecium sonneborni TaxID=65129 RepID=A0A8S1R6E8_9CILI|nr:unnamed protein product [Paramecium sonneborni]